MKITSELLQTKLLNSIDWNKVNGLDNCWLWKNYVKRYPQITIQVASRRPKKFNANRISIYLYHDHSIGNFYSTSWPYACHTCDNIMCVNPMHLFKGTASENKQDAIEKGRTSFGNKNGMSRLTSELIINIRKLYENGLTQEHIANKFDITQGHVSDIILRKKWKHVK